MRADIEYGPAQTWVRIQLEGNDSLQAEAGAMVRQTPGVEMETRLNAGRRAGFFRKIMMFFVALARKALGGETLFVNDFSAPRGGEVVLAPVMSGAITQRTLRPGESLLVQSGSYLASTGDIDTKLRWGGLRALFGGEGLILLECSGTGELFINSYGGITEVQVDGTYVVDTGHIVAFDGTLDFGVRMVGGLKASLFSGEGLVCEFRGRGKVYVQSRNFKALVGWVSRYLW
ncbi:MAG: TIGR00266 family protein [Bradymonadia bacterium]